MWRHLSKIIYSNGQRNYHSLSYAFCPSNEPLLPLCVSDLIHYNATNFPNKIAVISQHQDLIKTYGQLEKDVNQLAKALKHLGCQRGDRIGIWAPNCYEWILTQFATSKIGAIITFINPGYKAKELNYCLNLVNCHTIISSQKVKTSNYYEIFYEVIPSLKGFKETKNIQIPEVPFLKNIVMINDQEESAPKNFLRFNDLIKMEIKDELDTSENQFDDVTNIQFTSGTTGNPKGAALSHFNIVNNSKIFHRRCFEGMPNQDHKLCLQVPLYHCFGSVAGSLVAMHSQSTIVLPSQTFKPVASLEAIQKYKCDLIYGSPTMYVDLLAALDKSKYQLSSLVRGVMSGSNCPVQLLNQVKVKIPSVNFISIPYGSTETSPVSTANSIYDTIKQQTETVGRPLDHTEVKVIDPFTGRIQPTGQPGEVLTRGYNTFIGYWNQQEKTEEVVDNARWYKTGDIGVMDKDGYLSITGRIKDMIIRGGENIYPREIEEYLLTNPSIIDVHVVGVPDKRMGEEVCAFIRLKSTQIEITEKELKDFCKGKISHFKIPKYFEFVNDVPRTITGKVQKSILREIAAKKISK